MIKSADLFCTLLLSIKIKNNIFFENLLYFLKDISSIGYYIL